MDEIWAHSRLYVWKNAPLTLPGFALLPLKSAATALESQVRTCQKNTCEDPQISVEFKQSYLACFYCILYINQKCQKQSLVETRYVNIMYQVYSTISIRLYSDGFYFAQVSIYSTSPQHILFGQIAVLPLACTSQSFSKEWATTSFCALHQGHPLLWLASTRLLQKLLQLSRSLEEYRSRRVVPGYSHTAFFFHSL